ncbi:MAG: hypothetical protein R3C11_09495 [Planctomycetaceae bacterium]
MRCTATADEDLLQIECLELRLSPVQNQSMWSAQQRMAFTLMFDKSYSSTDEIRFNLFKFKVTETSKRPAWDYQYVIHQPEVGKEYGYRGRLDLSFVDFDDISEYDQWHKALND